MIGQILAICFDCGDTLADEGTEVKDESGTTVQAELIPGAADVLRALKQRGYNLALIADGPVGTFQNILRQHHLTEFFDAFAISELVGTFKPDPRMFRRALDQLGIAAHDYGKTIMVGNNLARDIKGANALGMISVWLDWAPRRPKMPGDVTETPKYTIKSLSELLQLVDLLESGQRT